MAQSQADEKVRVSLLRLLQLQGIRCSGNDLWLRRVTTRTGHPVYVVIGLNGTDKLLSRLARNVAGRRETSVGTQGVLLLRPTDLDKLIAGTSPP